MYYHIFLLKKLSSELRCVFYRTVLVLDKSYVKNCIMLKNNKNMVAIILYIKLDYITKKTHTIDITIYFIINDINILKIFKSILFIKLMLTF